MDHRERDESFGIERDERRMTITIGDVEYPARFEVCDSCEGKGHYVNPSIDSQGLTAEDFAEDPDFAEEYLAGRYDIPCNQCHGTRVVLMPATDEGKAAYDRVWQEEYDYRRCVEAERRMGC